VRRRCSSSGEVNRCRTTVRCVELRGELRAEKYIARLERINDSTRRGGEEAKVQSSIQGECRAACCSGRVVCGALARASCVGVVSGVVSGVRSGCRVSGRRRITRDAVERE